MTERGANPCRDREHRSDARHHRRQPQPHFLGLLTGAVAGLATITPAAGFVPIYASVVIGIVSAFVCYYAVQLKNRLRWDDALFKAARLHALRKASAAGTAADRARPADV